jgi:hypothetical protein
MKKLMILLCLILLQSCSSMKTGQVTYEEMTKNIRQNYDIAWNRILDWLWKNDISVINSDKDNGIIVADINLRDEDFLRYAECNDMSDALGLSKCKGEYKIYVEPDKEGGTNVKIKTTYICSTEESNKTAVVEEHKMKLECKTSGRLEDELLEYAGK